MASTTWNNKKDLLSENEWAIWTRSNRRGYQEDCNDDISMHMLNDKGQCSMQCESSGGLLSAGDRVEDEQFKKEWQDYDSAMWKEIDEVADDMYSNISEDSLPSCIDPNDLYHDGEGTSGDEYDDVLDPNLIVAEHDNIESVKVQWTDNECSNVTICSDSDSEIEEGEIVDEEEEEFIEFNNVYNNSAMKVLDDVSPPPLGTVVRDVESVSYDGNRWIKFHDHMEMSECGERVLIYLGPAWAICNRDDILITAGQVVENACNHEDCSSIDAVYFGQWWRDLRINFYRIMRCK